MKPDPLSVAIALLVEAALVAALTGLALRGRWRQLLAFTAYLAAVLTGNILITWWPERFWVLSFWVVKEATYAALLLGVVLELAWLTFRPFRGAATTARRMILVALLLLAALLALAPARDSAHLAAAGELLPRFATITVWLLAGVLALAHWYRVPWDRFHLSVAWSLVAHMTVFGVLLRLEGIHGWAAQVYLNALDPPAYLALTSWWAWVAWRPEPVGADARQHLLEDLGFEGGRA